MGRYGFANILLSGSCNQRCPQCIGRLDTTPRPDNLERFPLLGLDRFLAALSDHDVLQVSLTGTNTDPLLYHHTAALLSHLRRAIAGIQLSLHTNGVLALERMEDVNRYDRATISLPSFRPDCCLKMTGRARPLPLAEILERIAVPIKISTLVTEHNVAEIPEILERLRALGVRRAVLRRCVGEPRRWKLLESHTPVRHFGGSPVYNLDGLEVTVWDFAASTLGCLNLFSDGSLTESYRLNPNAYREQA